MTTVLYGAFHGQLGGAELTLLGLLDALDRERFTPIVLVGEDGPLPEALRRRAIPVLTEPRMCFITRRNLRPARVWSCLRTRERVVRALADVVRERRVDLVHAYVVAALSYAGPAARRAGVPVVATVHEPLDRFAWPRRRLLVASLNRFCDGITVPSDENRAVALRQGVRADRLNVVRTGIDVDRFRPDPAARRRVRDELDVAAEAPLVGMVARFNRGKGHDVLLRALAAMASASCDVRCVLVGDALFAGEHEWATRMRVLTRELGLEDRVIRVGWRDDMPAILAAIDVLAHPPTTPDSLPAAVLEAMAVGRPVVASAIGGLPELVEDGRTGCLVPPGRPLALAAALRGLLSDPATRAAMGAAGRRRVEREFSRQRLAQAMVGVYERLGRAGGRLPV